MKESIKEDITLKRALWFLIGTAFLSGILVEVGTVSINLSQVLAMVVLVLLIIHHAINRKKMIVLFIDGPSILLYLYLFFNFFSSLLFSPVKSQSFKACTLIFSFVLIYVVVRWILKYIIDKRKVIEKLMKYNNLSALLGLFCMAVSLYFGGQENIGVSLDQLGSARIPTIDSPLPSIKSLTVEPNLFAIITASILGINLAVYMLWKKSGKQLIIIGILCIAVLFAYTRSVYVSLGLALLCIIILANRIRILIYIVKYFILVSVMFIALMIFLPDDNDIKNALVSRGSTLLDFKQGSGEGRVIGLMIAWEGFKLNPVFGQGTLSANTTFYNPYTKEFQERMGSRGWLNGALIQAMHDTGVIGIIIVISLFISIIWSNYSVFRKLNNDFIEKSIILGFIAGNIILFIASQTSSTLWISFPYIYWAINMAFISWCKRELINKELPLSN